MAVNHHVSVHANKYDICFRVEVEKAISLFGHQEMVEVTKTAAVAMDTQPPSIH